MQNFSAIISTPFANNLTVDFAKALIEAYDLGNNPKQAPDMLAISFRQLIMLGMLMGLIQLRLRILICA